MAQSVSRLVACLLLLGMSVALAGCGGGGDPLAAAQHAARTTLAQAASVTVTIHGASLLAGGAASAQGGAEFDLSSGLGYERVDFSTTKRVFFDFLPTVVYLQPTVTSGLRGKAWLAVPFGTASGVPPPALALTLEALNPALVLGEIAWGGVSARSLGQRVLLHTPYTASVVTLSLTRALAGALAHRQPGLAAAIRGELAASEAAPRAALTVTIWVDGPGRVAQVKATLPGSKLGTVTFTLQGFGIAVPRSLPSASQSLPLSALPAARSLSAAQALGGVF